MPHPGALRSSKKELPIRVMATGKQGNLRKAEHERWARRIWGGRIHLTPAFPPLRSEVCRQGAMCHSVIPKYDDEDSVSVPEPRSPIALEQFILTKRQVVRGQVSSVKCQVRKRPTVGCRRGLAPSAALRGAARSPNSAGGFGCL